MLAKHIVVVAAIAVVALAACGKKTAPVQMPAEPAADVAAVNVNEGEPVDGEVTLTIAATAEGGSTIAPVFTGPANAADYIDIVPRGYTQTSGELSYIYIHAAAKGERLRVVTTPGEYDVRYVLDLKTERKVKAVHPLTVTTAAATLTAPTSAAGGGQLSIAWTGPGGDGDYIDVVPKGSAATSGEIAYAYTSSGNPAAFSAPGAAGEYQIRYVLEGPGERKVLASSALTVTQAAATLTAPATAKTGEDMIVEYEGPKRTGDYVDIVKKGYIATSGELSYFYADDKSANQLKMPSAAGVYEIRYVMEAPGGRFVLARQAITVE